MKLQERALLVKLTIGQWSARKTDRQATRETIESKNAQQGSGVFQKRLLGKKALEKINKIISAARTTHYTLTLPWDDNGARILTTEQYEHYAKVMRDYRINMQDALKEFLDSYDDLKAEAKESLGKLFNEDDYPEKSEIKSKFYMDVEPQSIPSGNDFRAKVSNSEAKAIADDIERRAEERLKMAINDIWKRVADVTSKMSEKLKNYDDGGGSAEATGVFRDTLVENVVDLVDLLPALNITNDPEIATVYKEMKQELTKYDAKTLREDKALRIATAKKANAIHRKVNKYII